MAEGATARVILVRHNPTQSRTHSCRYVCQIWERTKSPRRCQAWHRACPNWYAIYVHLSIGMCEKSCEART